jgi:anthranilate synthase/aminodeoxychorismate synthase-like glutamine amidotransferase
VTTDTLGRSYRKGSIRLFMLDNYDSFTYNLVQYLSELGADVEVERNDLVTPDAVAGSGYDGVVISPGPGVPSEAGISEDLIRTLSGSVPILGVCLGHQALGEVHGARVVRADRLMHGKTSDILHDGSALFRGLDHPFVATRYHSLILDRGSVTDPLEIIAWTDQDEVMGVKHRLHPSWGVQFHPESILTSAGKKLLGNFLGFCQGTPAGQDPALNESLPPGEARA